MHPNLKQPNESYAQYMHRECVRGAMESQAAGDVNTQLQYAQLVRCYAVVIANEQPQYIEDSIGVRYYRKR